MSATLQQTNVRGDDTHTYSISVAPVLNATLAFGGQITTQLSMTPAFGTWIIHKLTYNLASMEPKGAWFCDV